MGDSGDSYVTILYLEGSGTSNSTNYYITFSSSDVVYADSYVTAATFCSDSSLSFENYSGDAKLQSTYEKMAKYLIVDSLDATQYMFDFLGLPITIADFGFTAEYNAYNSYT